MRLASLNTPQIPLMALNVSDSTMELIVVDLQKGSIGSLYATSRDVP